MPKKSKSSTKQTVKPTPSWEWETDLGYPGRIIVGVDEVGRGCLAGPVVASALVLPSSLQKNSERPEWLSEVTDSKLITPKKRDMLAPLIREWAHASAIGIATVQEIDELNIHQASHLAMLRAIDGLGIAVDHVLVDGKFKPKGMKVEATAIIKGDQRCLSIACASILAKVWRDDLMQELEAKYPGYGLGVHKGYSTAVHTRALKEKGATEIHRRSFAPVAQLLSNTL